VKCDQETHAQDERQEDQPWVGVDQPLHGRVEEADPSDQGRHQQLNGQEAVHLSQEAHPETSSVEISKHSLAPVVEHGCLNL